MRVEIEIGGKTHRVQLPGTSVAIPMQFNGAQPNTYGVPGAVSKAYEQDGWVGDVRRGGSCNFETYTLTPHCNGTHTECVGHIAAERISVHDQIQANLVPATLVSISPTTQSSETYDPPLNPEDKVIEGAVLRQALEKIPPEFRQALILRTLPNEPTKKSRDYMQDAPAFFSHEAMRTIFEMGVQHLLVDMPSVDRLFDEGKLSNHHLFWGVEPGQDDFSAETLRKSITEMIFVPDDLPDGVYFLNLQVAAWKSDAAPSNPVLIPIDEKE